MDLAMGLEIQTAKPDRRNEFSAPEWNNPFVRIKKKLETECTHMRVRLSIISPIKIPLV
jgi:hypothetical protein